MFGYVRPDSSLLSPEERARWQAVYCGLCHTLHERYGSLGRATLTFDMTFLALLHMALEGGDEAESSKTCPRHPFRKQALVGSEALDYAADMNVALAYYNALDDWQDDRSRRAKQLADRLGAHMPQIEARWPRQCKVMADALARLSLMEQAGEPNPDLPANCFGGLLAALFVRQEDGRHAPALAAMGAALGRYIYLLDAVNDLRQDIRRQRYNPLTHQLDSDYLPALGLMMAECSQAFETLSPERDAGIIRNVLYAGVWLGMSRRAVRRSAENKEGGAP